MTNNFGSKRLVLNKILILIVKNIIVLGAFSLPEIAIVKFFPGMPLFANRISYTTPLMILTIIFYKINIGNIILEKFFMRRLFVCIATISIINIYHILNQNDDGGIYYELPIISFFLFFFSTIAIIKISETAGRTGNIFLGAPAFICLMQLMTYAEILPGNIVPLSQILAGARPEADNLNFSSHVAVFGLWVLYYSSVGTSLYQSKKFYFWGLTFLYIFVAVLNQTLGAIISISILAIFLVMHTSLRKNFSDIYIFYIIVFIIPIATIILIIFVLNSTFILNLITGESEQQRFWSIVAAINAWLQSPLLGIGGNASNLVLVNGLLVHSYPLRILMAYGALGFLAIFFLLVSLFSSCGRVSVTASSGLILLSCMLLLDPYLQWWYSSVIVISVLFPQR